MSKKSDRGSRHDPSRVEVTPVNQSDPNKNCGKPEPAPPKDKK